MTRGNSPGLWDLKALLATSTSLSLSHCGQGQQPAMALSTRAFYSLDCTIMATENCEADKNQEFFVRSKMVIPSHMFCVVRNVCQLDLRIYSVTTGSSWALGLLGATADLAQI